MLREIDDLQVASSFTEPAGVLSFLLLLGEYQRGEGREGRRERGREGGGRRREGGRGKEGRGQEGGSE